MSLSTDQRQALAKRLPASALKEQAYKRRLQNELYFFAQEAWNVLLPQTPFVGSWFLEAICRDLEAVSRFEIPRELINIPPGHAKSTFVSVMFPCWVWLTRPHLSFMFASYQLDLTLRDAEYCRTILESDWYRKHIPHRFGPKQNEPWVLQETGVKKILNSARGTRYSTSVTGGATGYRADFVVVDDAQKADEYVTPESQEKVWSWFEKAMSNRVNNEQQSSIVVIQQRLAERDLAGCIAEKDKEEAKRNPNHRPYKRLVFPTEYDPNNCCPEDIRTEPGELLFPERFPRDVIERARVTLGEYGYAAQHKQDPVAAGAGVFNLTKIKLWYDPKYGVPLPHKEKDALGNDVPLAQFEKPADEDPRWGHAVLSLDATFKDAAGSDFVALQAWKQLGTLCVLIDQAHQRASFTKTCEMLIDMSAQHPDIIEKLVEEKANGNAILDALSDRLFGMIAITPIGGKLSRANACAPLFDAGNICLPHPAQYPWVLGFLKELRGFPRAAHDDQVDSMTQALPKLIAGGTAWLQALVDGDRTSR